jgi:WhiB family redox-sensing transcriptional regulator
MTTIDQQAAQPIADYWEWQLSAACRGMDVETFYHPAGERWHQKNQRITQAKQICQHCPVINQCATWALRTREPYGVWGGLSETERATIDSLELDGSALCGLAGFR